MYIKRKRKRKKERKYRRARARTNREGNREVETSRAREEELSSLEKCRYLGGTAPHHPHHPIHFAPVSSATDAVHRVVDKRRSGGETRE